MSKQYLYCAFCGLPFSSDVFQFYDQNKSIGFSPVGYDRSIVSEKDVQWLEKFRVLAYQHDEKIYNDETAVSDNTAAVSIPAVWDEGQTVWFPPDGTDEGVYGESGDSIRAPVHESCLDIAYRVIRRRRRKPSDVSRTTESRPTSFKELLGAVKYYLPGTAYEGNVVWDNKFYGATDCWSQPWSSRAGTESFVANPLECEGLTEYIISCLNHGENGHGVVIEERQNSSRLSVLETLPAPALEAIVRALDLNSVLGLRSTSSKLYNCLPLTSRFWRDRLLTGDAVPWLWDLDADSMKSTNLDNDWEGLVKFLRLVAYGNRILPLGLKNRMRIWSIVSEIRSEAL